jgi:hypothetical protein
MKLVAGEEIGRGGFCMVHKVVAYEDDGGDPISDQWRSSVSGTTSASRPRI